MSKECPSCHGNYRYLLQCGDCGHDFCNICSDAKFVIIPIMFSKYDVGPGQRSACPDCGSDDYSVISEDDEKEESWLGSSSSDSEEPEEEQDSGGSYDSGGSSYSSDYSSSSSTDGGGEFPAGGCIAVVLVLGFLIYVFSGSNHFVHVQSNPGTFSVTNAVIAQSIQNNQPVGATTYFASATATPALFVNYENAGTNDDAVISIWANSNRVAGCNQSRLAPGTGYVWCAINSPMGTGNYNFEMTVNGTLVGTWPFTIANPQVPQQTDQTAVSAAPPSPTPDNSSQPDAPTVPVPANDEAAREAYAAGQADESSGNFSKSANEFAQVVAAKHQNTSSIYYESALMDLGRDYESLHQYERAFQVYDEGVSNASNSNFFMRDRCWAGIEAKHDPAATFDDCDKFVQSNPGGIDQYIALKNRGFALLRLGRYSEAVSDFSAALAADSTLLGPSYDKEIFGEATFGRGIAELRTGDQDAGNRDISGAQSIDPQVGETLSEFDIAP